MLCCENFAGKETKSPRASRRGDWYARKETQRRDEIDIVRPKDALRQHVFALCHSFQDDYQSSCGLTTVGIIANFCAALRKTRHSGHAGRVPLPTAVASRTTSHLSITRSRPDRMTAKTEKNQNSASIAAIMRSTRVFICETEFLEMPNSAATSAMGRSSMTYAR